MPSAIPPRPRPAGLIFDLDGTLVDSLDDIATSVNLTRGDLGLAPLGREAVAAFVGDGSEALVRRAIPVPESELAATLARYHRAYQAHLLDRTHLMPGVLPVLEFLAGRPLAVVTNKPQDLSERILSGLGIREHFTHVLGGDTLPQRKPTPDPLLHVIRAWHLAPGQTLMVGDGVNDILAAKAAGMPVVAVSGGVSSRAELEALQPTWLVHGIAALLSVID